MVDRDKLERARKLRLIKAEKVAGIREGHYRFVDEHGVAHVVHVWVAFYPKIQWYYEFTTPPRCEPIPGTARLLDENVKKRLESWL